VDNLQETDALLAAGADELYGGYIPAVWQERYGLAASANQRTFAAAQIASFDQLCAIVERVRRKGGRFALTLNAPFYSAEQQSLLVELVERAVPAGIHGVILADLGLLRTLRRAHPQLQYHASTLAHLMNSAAVSLYLRQGIDRVIFPRHLSLGEMEATVRQLPQTPFDAFMLIGKCPNTEGLCTFQHSSPERVWPCEIPYDIAPLHQPASAALQEAMRRQRSWSLTDRRHGCGLCAIPRLQRMGISALKLVGRGAPAAQKVRNIELVRRFLALAQREDDAQSFYRAARQQHRQHFAAPCSTNVCYYPELYQAEE
jgi:U32 family peptidase